MSGDPRVKRSLFQTSYTMFSVFYTKSIFIKSQICIIGGLRVVLGIQIEGLNLEFEREAGLITLYGRRDSEG